MSEAAEVAPEGAEPQVDAVSETPDNGPSDSSDSSASERVSDEGHPLPPQEASAPEAFNPLEDTVEGMDIFLRDKPYKGISRDEVKKLPLAAQQVIHNLRLDYQQKTQKLADERRGFGSEMQGERDTIAREREQFRRERERLLRLFADRDLLGQANTPEATGEEAVGDAGTLASLANDPDKLQEYVAGQASRQAQAAIRDMLAPLQRQAESESRKMRLDRFINERPDFHGLKGRIRELLEGGSNRTLEDAYEMARGEAVSQRLLEMERKERATNAARATSAGAMARGGSAPSGSPRMPKLKGARAIAEWLAQHPEYDPRGA